MVTKTQTLIWTLCIATASIFYAPISSHDAKACFQREKKLAEGEKCRLPLHSLESASVGTPWCAFSSTCMGKRPQGPCRSPQHASVSRAFLFRRRGKAQAHHCARIIRSSLRIIHSRRRFLLCALASRRFASFFGVFFLFFLASFQKTGGKREIHCGKLCEPRKQIPPRGPASTNFPEQSRTRVLCT